MEHENENGRQRSPEPAPTKPDIAPFDGGVLDVPPDGGGETEEERLKRLAAQEEHQERERAGSRMGKI
jgi:hypothetical protein